MYERANITHCRSCGARIRFIRTKNGRNMPVNENGVFYSLEDNKDRLVTPSGEVVSCKIVDEPVNRNMYGYMSHFATCPNANQHRR